MVGSIIFEGSFILKLFLYLILVFNEMLYTYWLKVLILRLDSGLVGEKPTFFTCNKICSLDNLPSRCLNFLPL